MAEDVKLDEIWERRRMEGSSLQAEVIQKVRELAVHERMSQFKEVHKRKEESERMVHGRDERQGEQSFGRRLRRNEKIERYESGRDGSLLEEFGGKN